MTQSTIDVYFDVLLQPFPSSNLFPKYEIDCAEDADFGNLWRMWDSYHLLGTFYEDSEGYWIPQPCKSDFRPRLKSELQAQLVLIAIYENPELQTI